MTTASLGHRPDIADLLAFYASAGVDDALEDAPVNRFAEQAPKPAPRAPAAAPSSETAAPQRPAPPQRVDASSLPDAPTRPLPATATVPDGAQAALARQLASAASTLEELRQHMADFDGCNLKFTAKNLVFADGNPNASVMLVGEAPGRDEDIEGLPFVGRSGRLLDRMLAAIGLDRTSVYIANVIPWRPPGNRTPTPHETEICRPFIERQIELVNPKVLVNLGGPSAKTLLNTTEGILRLRGNWRTHTTASGTVIPAMPTLHPAYLLRTPAHKKLAWRDFLEVKAKLRELG
jgi:DNA polymerase